MATTRPGNDDYRAAHGTRALVQFLDAVCQMTKRNFPILGFNDNTKSLVLYIYFNGASTGPFVACSGNNKGCEEEAIITK